MHIKQVLISGFRSFRSQNEIESFSPKHNVIVGRNGSGKSNFFDAIQFVLLGPKFAGLRQEDRQHLLHEGAGTSVMAAYVEIIFDNSDGRLSVESDEVVLRRTVGLKKDEFFLNRKRVQKSEVMSLLESAGFSKSNPYYIVQQGKVSNLCVMKDKDRLNLLKEVAGTTVYEERRTESIKIMQETANKQQKVEEVLSFIDERLSELEQEKKELTEYEQLDKQRRALQFTVYDKEYAEANEKLTKLELLREEERDKQQTLYSNLREIQDEAVSIEENLQSSRQALDRLHSRREVNVAKITELTAKKSAVEVELAESDVNAAANKKEVAKLRAQLAEVEGQIQTCEKELRQVIEPEFAAKTAAFEAKSAEFDSIHSHIEALYGKQGRGTKFATRAQRDEFLQQQINTLNKQVAAKKKLFEKQQADIAAEEARVERERAALQAGEAELQRKLARYDEVFKINAAQTQQRNALQERKKSHWKDLDDIQERIIRANQELDNARQGLNRALPRHISQGLAAINAIVDELGLRAGYFGLLVDNFQLTHEGFRTAVEVAAGNNLFHIIVDTDDTAARLMKELDRRKAGRLTFLPLNRLRNPPIEYPQSNDVAPLMSKALIYDKRIEEAIKQVFGNKLLARDIDTATKISKQHNLDCITKDGDLANRKGGMEGGYHDEKHSRILSVQTIARQLELLQELRGQESNLKAQSEASEREINDAIGAIQQLEAERENLRINNRQLKDELVGRTRQLNAAVHALEGLRQGLNVMQVEIKTFTDQISTYTAEKDTVLDFTEAERAELVALESRQRELQPQVDAQRAEIMGITARKEKRTADLENNLVKRRDEISAALSSLSSKGGGAGDEVDLEALKKSLQLEESHLEKLLEAEQAELKQVSALLQTKKRETVELETSLEALRKNEKEVNDALAQRTAVLDKILNKRSVLQEQVSTKQREIRELGVTPQKERDEFKNLDEAHLMRKLKQVNEQLKKYSSVNKKALDQYVSFNQQREELISKKEEMDADNAAIQQLIDSLDMQKDEAILRTFRNVSRHFSEVFRELVPSGVGTLIMKTSMDADKGTTTDDSELQDHVLDDDDEDEEDGGKKRGGKSGKDKQQPAISTFQGVQVSVSFSGAGQQYQMQQLSGGQKALVALALIFAIQRCDPAPFYLFDEIDQALDANYRAGVARLIQKQVESEDAPAQFITTTFRPELVEVADKWYGIALTNKVSNIYPLKAAEAKKFVTDLLLEDEAVGKVSSMAALSSRGPSQVESSYEAGGESNEVEYDPGDESPAKTRKVSRGAAAAAKKGAAGKRRSGRVSGSSRGSSRRQSREVEDEEEEDQEGMGSDMEGEYIDLDDEEQAVFENLNIGDEEEDEEGM